jgi:nucleotide-binding universal stress UspA family protein
MSTQGNDDRRIVVGVDGSPSSTAALRWAIGQAKLTGCAVDAVTAWHIPAGYGFAPIVDDGVDWAGDAGKVLFDTLNEVAGEDPDVIIRPIVEEGPAAEVLVRAARGADLLVVGCRGHGGFARTLLGSVSQQCAHHAHCPVLIMRDGT